MWDVSMNKYEKGKVGKGRNENKAGVGLCVGCEFEQKKQKSASERKKNKRKGEKGKRGRRKEGEEGE